MNPQAVFDMLGVRPIVVAALGREALYLPDDGLILIDSDAGPERAADWALGYVADVATPELLGGRR